MVLYTQMTTVIYSSDQKRLHCLSRRDVDPQMAVLVADRLSTASNWPLANYMHYTSVSESTSTTWTLRSLLTYLYLFSSSSIWNLHTMCETLKWAFFWPCVGTDLSLEHRSNCETFALFSEYFCPYCTNFIYVIIEQKLPYSEFSLPYLPVSRNCPPPRMADLATCCLFRSNISSLAQVN